MSQKQITAREIEAVLEQMVIDGHAEKDSHGSYNITPEGHKAFRLRKFADALQHLGQGNAITYAGLIYVTQFSENHLNEVIVQSMNLGWLKMGCLAGSERQIFYCDDHHNSAGLNLVAHPSESTGDELHWAGELALLKQIKKSDS